MRLPSKPPFPLLFQSTLPARGATAWTQNCRWPANFNPRSLHGERRRRTRPEGFCPRISIHAPCTGSDERRRPRPTRTLNFNPRSLHGERRARGCPCSKRPRFQSTLPARGATPLSEQERLAQDISIHAPCTGSDESVRAFRLRNRGISIHAPCTGSDPARGRTRRRNGISIHAPCTGSDNPA